MKKLYTTKEKLVILLAVVILLTLGVYYGSHAYTKYTKVHYGDIGGKETAKDNIVDPEKDPEQTPLTCCVFDLKEDALCVLVDIGNAEIIYGTGTEKSAKKAIKKVEPYVDGALEYMILPHDSDQLCGGAGAFLEKFRIDTVITSGEKGAADGAYAKAVAAAKKKCNVIGDGDMQFELDGGAILEIFETLDPKETENSNDLSVVALVRSGENSVLVTGDAEVEAERTLLGKISGVTLFVAGHYLGDTANSAALLQEWEPDYVFASCGKGGKNGYPGKAAVERMETLGIEDIYATFKAGDLTYSSGNGLEGDGYVQLSKMKDEEDMDNYILTVADCVK